MTQLDNIEYVFYSNGTSGAGPWVGWIGKVSRVVRYSFKTPPNGADFISFGFGYHAKYGTMPLRFYIGTTESETTHANASKDSPYTGVVEMVEQDGGKYDGLYASYGEANMFLLPNTTYYLWIFPAAEPSTDNSYEWFNSLKEIYVDGTAGLVRIGDDVIAQPYIHDGTEWKLTLPYVCGDENWKICG